MLEAEALVGELLGVRPNGMSCEEAGEIARVQYDLSGTIEALRSERDQNFRITTADGDAFVLKIAHPAEEQAVTMLQTAALAHIAAADPELPVPHIVRTLDGALSGAVQAATGQTQMVRVLTYLPGRLLHEVQTDASLLHALGVAAGRLDKALQGFDPSPAGQTLLWDLTRLSQVRPLLDALDHDPDRDLVLRSFEAFETIAVPKIPLLRRGFTHHDLNPHNVLVAPGRVSGILDFGDMTQAPLVSDLAIASAYHLGEGLQALAGVGACVSGYNSSLPLTVDEMAILPILIAGRLAMTVTITEWRARRDPGNAPYILRNNPAARRGLAALDAIGWASAAVQIADACARRTA